MSETHDAEPARQRFSLRAEPPVRALAIASACALVGAVVLVLWAATSWPIVVLVVGVVLLAFGVLLALTALALSWRLRQTLVTDSAQISLVRGWDRRTLRWSDVAEVQLNGSRLSLVTKGEPKGVQVINPGGYSAAIFDALVKTIRTRLDADRGYSDLGS